MTAELPDVKLRALVNFPVSVTGRTGIDIEKTNGRYYLDLDLSRLVENPNISADQVDQSWMLIWNKVTDAYEVVPYALAATSGVASIGGNAGALDIGDGLVFTGDTLEIDLNISARTFATRADLAAATIPASVNYVQTSNYATLGDNGGGRYVRGSAGIGVGYVTSADGAIWRLADQIINVRQFGAVPNSVSDYTSNIADAFNFANANPAQVQSIDFGEGTFGITAELPTPNRIVEIFGRTNGNQPTILLKNFVSSDATKGMLNFAQYSPYIHDLDIRATGGSGGSAISIINPPNTANVGQITIDRVLVSGGNHYNYSLYLDGTANTVSPIGLRNVFGSHNYFFGAAIDSVYLNGVHQFLMSSTVFDTVGGSGSYCLVATGTPAVQSTNISITGIWSGVSFDYVSLITLNGVVGTITTTANSSDWSISGPNSSFGTNRLLPLLYAALPLPTSGTKGMLATIVDSNTATWGAAMTGGGPNVVLAFCNGTNWTVAGK